MDGGKKAKLSHEDSDSDFCFQNKIFGAGSWRNNDLIISTIARRGQGSMEIGTTPGETFLLAHRLVSSPIRGSMEASTTPNI
ncbi:hypothetical protein SDJN02_26473, partial [Cucurbita argyrosperma subsp. argyrosperma]